MATGPCFIGRKRRPINVFFLNTESTLLTWRPKRILPLTHLLELFIRLLNCINTGVVNKFQYTI